MKSYLKLKSILNLLVPSLVRDQVRSQNNNFLMEEGEVTMCFIDIKHFDLIVQLYSGKELLQLLDKLYNVFDQLCDQFGV